MKKYLSLLLVMLLLICSSVGLTSCGGSIDSDNDGFTDDFEDEHGDVLDKDNYNWDVDMKDLMD